MEQNEIEKKALERLNKQAEQHEPTPAQKQILELIEVHHAEVLVRVGGREEFDQLSSLINRAMVSLKNVIETPTETEEDVSSLITDTLADITEIVSESWRRGFEFSSITMSDAMLTRSAEMMKMGMASHDILKRTTNLQDPDDSEGSDGTEEE